jgi:hypothetical protein
VQRLRKRDEGHCHNVTQFWQAKQEEEVKAHRAELTKRMKDCSKKAQALFCLACAERLIGCAWCFEQQTGASLGGFFRWLDTLFVAVASDELGEISLQRAASELEEVIPSGDHDGSPLHVQAQSAVLCALNALSILVGPTDRAPVIEAANSVVDALDNYTYFVGEELANRTDSPENYELLQREIAKQLRDCELLRREVELTKGRILEWRIENRQYAVPAAVGSIAGR